MLDTTVAATSDAHDPAPASHLGCYCNSPRTGWIVATTHPQAEPWAETNLQHRGYRTYLPLVLRPRRDRSLPTLVHHVLAPLWSGYIFVHHDTRDSWRPIYETPGVRSVLRNRDQIQFAPDAAIEALREGEAARSIPTTPDSLYRPGAPCEAVLGGGSRVEAVVAAVNGQKATVLALMFGELREVTVELANLRLRCE